MSSIFLSSQDETHSARNLTNIGLEQCQSNLSSNLNTQILQFQDLQNINQDFIEYNDKRLNQLKQKRNSLPQQTQVFEFDKAFVNYKLAELPKDVININEREQSYNYISNIDRQMESSNISGLGQIAKDLSKQFSHELIIDVPEIQDQNSYYNTQNMLEILGLQDQQLFKNEESFTHCSDIYQLKLQSNEKVKIETMNCSKFITLKKVIEDNSQQRPKSQPRQRARPTLQPILLSSNVQSDQVFNRNLANFNATQIMNVRQFQVNKEGDTTDDTSESSQFQKLNFNHQRIESYALVQTQPVIYRSSLANNTGLNLQNFKVIPDKSSKQQNNRSKSTAKKSLKVRLLNQGMKFQEAEYFSLTNQTLNHTMITQSLLNQSDAVEDGNKVQI
eukprot:403377299